MSVNETADYDRPPSSLLSSAGSAPSYSSLPRPEEETVQYTRRHRGSDPPSDGTYIKSWESLTLILHDQLSNGAERPTYDRHSLVAGEIELKRPENVLAVVIKVRCGPVVSMTWLRNDSNTARRQSYNRFFRNWSGNNINGIGGGEIME
jgi:hypothetical protein